MREGSSERGSERERDRVREGSSERGSEREREREREIVNIGESVRRPAA